MASALSFLDWIFVVSYFVFALGIALYYYTRAGKNTTEFFLSGRSMPWWIIGTSMVATTFAADTPLAVTEMVALDGIAGNWLWWNFLMGGMLTVFFFARLWRRSGVLTDVEFIELRYSGPEAAWLRGIKAIYFGLLMNVIILGWVTLAMETIFNILFPGLTLFGQESFSFFGIYISAPLMLVGFLIIFVGFFSLISGLWGVAVTDIFQFAIALGGTIVLAVYAVNIPEIGGISGLQEKLPPETFRFLPSFGDTVEGVAVLTLSFGAFAAYFGVQWWSSWYPGSEPGGGGYVAQRIMSAKDEKHSLFATLWFNIAHYCLRPWPWIIVALVSLVLYPDLTDSREGFVLVMRDVLPSGLLGLLFAAFLAAFTSTFAAHLNWGTSYLVNDFWRRFIKKDADEKYYVMVSRILTFVLAIVAFFVTTQLDSIRQAWGLVLTASGGLGLVLILRWYWWRINAWSELAASLTPIFLVFMVLLGVPVPGIADPFPMNLFYVVGITTVVWLLVTFLTKPSDRKTLTTFYRRVRPGGPGWAPLVKENPDVNSDGSLWPLLGNWVAGVIMVYMALFGFGHFLFGNYGYFFLCLAIGLVALAWLYMDLSKRGFDTIIEHHDPENPDERVGD
ncbi:MAG: sodium:proline symporter [Balneolaceae bacterium]|nr:MAG: sodium:proline symporter [Balneolaceae bacterium]